MKYKPNSNLLTIADSPFPQRFVELILFIYIIKNIDKILRDSPNYTNEESLDNETVRSDRFMSTLCKTDVATWRHKVSHEAFGGAQGEEGTPPWLLLAAVPENTPSVSDEPNFFGGGSGASTTNSARITGMYFYHPDHLGSITMITDGRGNVLAGGERGGKSHITYRPYGEILRTDSYGPDISKYKYTGQEEDRESGLMYYKARYYDAKIGRFLQQDSMAFPTQVQGMNRMMYVEGNPVAFNDPSGNIKGLPNFSKLAKHMIGGLKWAAKGIKNTLDRVSEGKKSRKGADFGSAVIRKSKESITFQWRLLTNPSSWLGLIGVMYDLTIGTAIAIVTGKPVPTLHYSNGGIIVKNSQFFNIYNGTLGDGALGVTMGQYAFVPEGASLDTILHEKGHLKQFNNQGGWSMMTSDTNNLELENDNGAGFTHGYGRISLYIIIASLFAGNDIRKRNELINFLLFRYAYMGFSK